MPDNKNLFDFGTGSIDRDQWLRDIDNELEDFITRYGSATNKHRTALLRLAFQELRARIANGNMLNRTADGLYQFGSALNREDKHMLEAYQRALGFMGNLARKLIKAPTPLEEKKYGTSTLLENWLKYLNPSGKFNEKAYWAEGDDASRIAEIKKFLEQEKNGLGAYTGYDGYKDRADLESRIQAFLDSPTERNLQRLGFDNRNWITKPVEEVPEEEQKSELEQALERYNAALLEQQTALLNQQILAMTTPDPVRSQLFLFTPSNYWTYDSYARNLDAAVEALKETDTNGNTFLKAQSPLRRTPRGDGRTFTLERTKIPTAWNGEAAEQARTYAQLQYNAKYHDELNNFFKGLGINYLSYLDNSDKLKALQTNLAKLFTVNPEGSSFISPGAISKYFVQNLDGTYGLKGSNISYDPSQGILYQTLNISNYKEGGVIKGEDGLIFDSSRYIQLPTLKKAEESKLENSQFSNSENARIAATIADITSMGAAFVPGYGTAASAVLGLGSTATNFGADLADGAGLWDATKNAGFGLAADVMGLIPGLGGVGKGAKIARNLMWAVPKMMLWVNTFNGISNAKEIKNSILKLTTPSSMTLQDWLNVSLALQIMTGHGRSVATKVKKAGMTKTTTTTDPEYYVYTNKGKQKVSDETFKKLRETRGTKSRQALTQELMGEGVTLLQTRFAPWNTSTRFGAFKEVPGRTTIEVQNKHKGWFSDENLVEKAENINPSVDIRGILTKINPYRSYYSNRNLPIVPEKNYSRLSIFPADSPLNIHSTTPNVLPHPTGEKYAARPTEQPKVQPNPQSRKKHKKKHKKYEIGGILYALRNGGIVKAQWGDNTADWDWTTKTTNTEQTPLYTNPYFPEAEFKGTAPWYKQRFNSESLNSLIDSKKYTNPNLQGRFTGTNLDFAFSKNMSYVKSGLENKLADIQNYFNQTPMLNASSLEELTLIYNLDIDLLYNTFNKDLISPDYKKTDASTHNNLFRKVYQSRATGLGDLLSPDIGWDEKQINIFGSNSFARRPVNYETKFEDDLQNNIDQAKDRVSKISYNGIEGYVYTDENGRIHPLSADLLKMLVTLNGIPSKEPQPSQSSKNKAEDSEKELDTQNETKFKNPFDPTLLSVAGKTILGLRGNRDIFGNLLKEMPEAPLRDPINRQLAIVGWQERIKEGLNQLADLRRILQMQRGSDQQTNFATALETERTGRDIMDKAFQQDSLRQFETALKLWNLKNEDILYNVKVGDDNRKAIADRARMMAQIRAAWRSGDNNIKMGAFSDVSNLLLKRYQREQDIIDKARELLLGTPEERALSRLYESDKKYASIMDKYQSGQTLTDEERAYVKSAQAKALRTIRGTYSLDYYNMFHTPGFGGGYYTAIAKDGTKLEVAKLKARGKDNDRYVSMIKDLRQSSRRRRRR